MAVVGEEAFHQKPLATNNEDIAALGCGQILRKPGDSNLPADDSAIGAFVCQVAVNLQLESLNWHSGLRVEVAHRVGETTMGYPVKAPDRRSERGSTHC
ncbi:hypothetical protein [Pseudomonas citronellolis]|uniref:hypothetical protein n=1 Tax=Pseudomonas citronellolis TaxID=53408 RepID=UPI0023E436D6|nr:hypothetical protein [Pseudomonas citronellolis]MDF3932146.1 hypothetical protein [Pseudomonas citronellolis]